MGKKGNTDWSRLVDYVVNYFPEPKYSKQDIRDWAKKNVPAWNVIGEKDKENILFDWENVIFEAEVEPEIKEFIEGKSRSFLRRVRDFLGRLF